MCTRLLTLTLTLLDDFVFAKIWGGGGKAGGAGSSGVAGIGVGSTHSSSSRSTESDDTVDEKSTAVGLLLCGRVLVLAALGVTGPTGPSPGPPPLPPWPTPEIARKERRPPVTALPCAPKKSLEESGGIGGRAVG
jgi:hypothetical protein